MSLFLLGFLAGALVCASFPQFADWLRGCSEAVGLFLQRAIAGVRPHAPNIPINYAKAPETSDNVLHWSTFWAGAGRALSNLARFLWTFKWAILVILLFFFGMGLLRGCVRLPLGESREHAVIRADIAERVAEHNREIGAASVRITDAFHAREASITHDLENAREAVESVPDDAAAIDVLRAWARADRSLLDGGNASG